MYGFRFRVESDFAHFRDPSTQQILETFIGPPKSAIIGLIGAALGLSRERVNDLNGKLEIGVSIKRIDGWRKETVNIHNLKDWSKDKNEIKKYKFEFLNQNMVSPTFRKSIVNPKYEIAVFTEDKSLLNEINESLKKPAYPLYLGISEYLAWISYISDIFECEKKIADDDQDKIFDCFIPNPSKFIPYSKEGFSIKPEIYKVPIKTYTKGKKRKAEFIDLLMHYNVDVRLMEEKEYLLIEDEKYITM